MHNLTRSVQGCGSVSVIFSFYNPTSCVCAQYLTPPAPPTQWPVCPSYLAGAELFTIDLPAAECFVQHNTKPTRIWCYRSSCPFVSEGEKMGMESAKSESVESLCHPQQ